MKDGKLWLGGCGGGGGEDGTEERKRMEGASAIDGWMDNAAGKEKREARWV